MGSNISITHRDALVGWQSILDTDIFVKDIDMAVEFGASVGIFHFQFYEQDLKPRTKDGDRGFYQEFEKFKARSSMDSI